MIRNPEPAEKRMPLLKFHPLALGIITVIVALSLLFAGNVGIHSGGFEAIVAFFFVGFILFALAGAVLICCLILNWLVRQAF